MQWARTLKASIGLFRIQLTQSLQYRLAALSGTSISVFWAMIEIVVLTVFYTHSSGGLYSTGGLTLAQAVSYIWIAQMLVPLQSMGIDGEIVEQINSGNVGIELCRPLDLYAHWFARTAGGRVGNFLLRSSGILLIGALLPAPPGLAGPASAAGFGLFLLSLFCAFLLCMAYSMLVTALRLNVTWGEGPSHMLLLVGQVLSGAYLPLQLWPDFMQRALLLQPFAGYVDIPARLYVGSMTPNAGLGAIGLQLLWTALFIIAGRMLMRYRLRTLIVQGG